METPVAWLTFTLGPVQEYVQSARTVRDLQAGSRLLSLLTNVARDECIRLGARILFPATRANSCPNIFTASFDDLEQANQAAEKCRGATQERWEQIAGQIRGVLPKNWSSGWDACWSDQVKTYWQIGTAVITHSGSVGAYYPRLFAAPPSNTWHAHWQLLGSAVSAQKQVRHFPGNNGIGRGKCTMFGDLEQMGPGGKPGNQDEFWRSDEVRRFRHHGLRLREHERLCAPGFVKRFASAVCKELSINESIPDTGGIALGLWLKKCREASPSHFDQWKEADKKWRDVLKDADTQSRYLLDEDLSPKKLVFEERFSSDETPTAKDAAEGLVAACKDLVAAARGAGLGPPPRYFALLQLDGDEIGDTLKELDAEALAKFSGRLAEYSEKANEIISGHGGFTVYAGGDDLLALLPAESALECAVCLRCAFRSMMEERAVSESTGIVICHYKHDLHHALRMVRNVLLRAKDSGKDCIAWQVQKHSGGTISGTLSWDLASRVNELKEDFAAEASDRWVYAIERLAPQVPETAPEEQAVLLLRHFLLRVETDNGDVVPAVENFYGDFSSYVQSRNEQLNKSLPDNKKWPTRGGVKFVQAVLDEFVPALMLASFLVRGRD